MKSSRNHTRNRTNHAILVAVGLAMALAVSTANAEMIAVSALADSSTSTCVGVTSPKTMEWDWNNLYLPGGGDSGLIIDTFEVNIDGFAENGDRVSVEDIIVRGFEGGQTVTLQTSNETMIVEAPHHEIGLGVIAMDIAVSPSGPLAKDGNTYTFSIDKLAIVFVGPIVTAANGGTVVSGSLAAASLSAVPEPSSIVMMLLAGLGLPVVWYRRRSA